MGLVYRLFASADPDNFYVGSTKNTLKVRLGKHKCAKENSRAYMHLRQYGKATWTIELVEEYDGELRKREEYWRVQLGATLNTNRAYSTVSTKRETQARWVKENMERHRRYHCEYQRKLRARKKAARLRQNLDMVRADHHGRHVLTEEQEA